MPPRRRPTSNTRTQPFSLILDPSESTALRRIAKARNTSMGALVREVIATVLMASDPAYGRRIIERDVDRFLDQVSERLPIVKVDNSLRRRFKRLVTSQAKL